MSDFVGLMEIFEVELRPMHAGRVAVSFESFYSFIGVFFFWGKEDDFRGVVLEDVSCDAETDAGRAACNDIDLEKAMSFEGGIGEVLKGADLAAQIRNILVGVKLVAGNKMGHCG